MKWFVTLCKIVFLTLLPVAVSGVCFIPIYVTFIFPHQESVKSLTVTVIADHPFLFYLYVFVQSVIIFLRLWIKAGEDYDKHPYEH